MMPRKDGYSACHEIKSDPTTRPIPVVMVTGIGHKLNEKLSAEVGADGYMTKPFSLEKLPENRPIRVRSNLNLRMIPVMMVCCH